MEKRPKRGLSLFSMYRSLIDMEIKNLKDYINEISTDLKAKQQSIEKDYKSAIQKFEKEKSKLDDEYDVESFFEDDLYKYYKVFPAYTYNPLLLIIYGNFENWLKELCELNRRQGFSLVQVSDLAGYNYIEKSRKYLSLIAEISLYPNEPNWIKITEFQKIRNCIAHHSSNIIKNPKKNIEEQELYKTISNDKRFYFDKSNGDFYIRDKHFLFEVIDIIKKYLHDLIEVLNAGKVVAKNTIMPYNNIKWGQEKTEALLDEVIASLNLIDNNETRTDEFKDSDLKFNLRGNFKTMAFNLTKLYAFFCNGQWEAEDRNYIVEEREKGLKKLKKLYGLDNVSLRKR